MGFFSGLKKRWNDGSLMNGLQAAGAIANGDYATAAQIKGLYQRQREEQAQAEAEKQQRAMLVQAAVENGVPPEQASALPSNALAQIVSSRFGQQADGEFTRTLKAAGIDPASEQGRALYAQRAATMASPAPQMVGSHETGYRFITPPAPTLPGQGAPQAPSGPAPGTEMGGFRFKGGNPNDRNNWEPAGGAVSNGGSTFLDAFAQYRF